MISVHIIYPRTDDSTFDMDYYVGSHMPMLASALGDSCQGWGASAPPQGDIAAIGWAMVDDKESFDAAMAEHGAAIIGDVPNYTNVQPQLVIGDVAAS